jgi:hypothetical protein
LSCMVYGEGRFWSKSGYVISAASCILDSHCSPDLQDCTNAQYHTYANGGCINLNPACNISYINIDNWICVYEYHFGTNTIILCSDTTLQGMYLVQCYCAFPSDCAFVYNRLWSLKDYAAEQTILDPNGILNYLAIGYS